MRRKWIAAGLLVLVLFSYELFAAWELPAATAWIVVGYFALALVVDLLFKGGRTSSRSGPTPTRLTLDRREGSSG